MKSIFQIGAAAALLLSLQACSKEAVKTTASPETGSVLDYYNFITQKSDGVFGIKSYTTRYMQDSTRVTYTGGAFVDANNNSLPGGTVSIGNILLNDSVVSGSHNYGNNTIQGTQLFGTNTTFNINPNPGNTITGKNASITLYAPSLISINSVSPPGNMQAGTVMTWHADAQNPKNVLIVMEYDPTLKGNDSVALSYPKPISTSLAVPDNGSYHFERTDFTQFPPAAWLNIKLIRLNYARAISTDKTASYLVYSYNGVDALFFHP
jgi:hypothetical protein